MPNDNKNCNLSEGLKNMGCEMKLAYLLIVALIIFNVFVFTKLFTKQNSNESIDDWVSKNPKAILDSVQRYAEEEQAKAQKQQEERTERP